VGRSSSDDEELRVLPYNLEAEKAALGAILINPALLEQALAVLRPEQFFRRAHRSIYKAIIELDERKVVPDMVTVFDELRRRDELEDAGGPAYVSSLTDGVPRSANVRHYCELVRETAVLRELIDLGKGLVDTAYKGEERSTEIVAMADRRIIDLQRGNLAGRMFDLRESMAGLYEDLERRANSHGAILGVDTGFPTLNELTFGWQPGDMIVIAARPSIGKTAFTLNTAVAAARAGKRVGIFSLEMRRRQLEYRLLSNISKVPLTRILGGYLGDGDYEGLVPAMAVFNELPIFVDDRSGLTAVDVRSACRRLKNEGGLDLVVVDYIQLMSSTMSSKGHNRNAEIADISRRLKVLADEVGVPMLVLSQLSRAGRDRTDKRPRLEDLRDSGALEQDADLVLFLHRKDHRQSGITECILEKQRNGPTGTVNLSIDRDTQTFTDQGLEPEQPALPPAPPAAEGEPVTRPPKGWRRKPR